MPSWQSAHIEANGLKLHYTRTGGDKPPVVLAHGFSDAGLCWTPVAEALAADYDIIMVDARGHGLSDAPAQGYGTAEQAGDLAGVITGLALKRPALLGHSMGAATILAMAGLHPELPGAILLEDPPRGGCRLTGADAERNLAHRKACGVNGPSPADARAVDCQAACQDAWLVRC